MAVGHIDINVLNLDIARDLALALAEIRSNPAEHATCIESVGAPDTDYDERCDTCRRADVIIAKLAQGA